MATHGSGKKTLQSVHISSCNLSFLSWWILWIAFTNPSKAWIGASGTKSIKNIGWNSVYSAWLICKFFSEWNFWWPMWYQSFFRGWKNCDLYAVSVLFTLISSYGYYKRYHKFTRILRILERYMVKKLIYFRPAFRKASTPSFNRAESL